MLAPSAIRNGGGLVVTDHALRDRIPRPRAAEAVDAVYTVVLLNFVIRLGVSSAIVPRRTARIGSLVRLAGMFAPSRPNSFSRLAIQTVTPSFAGRSLGLLSGFCQPANPPPTFRKQIPCKTCSAWLHFFDSIGPTPRRGVLILVRSLRDWLVQTGFCQETIHAANSPFRAFDAEPSGRIRSLTCK
jgi:hypothetical protein